MVNSKRSPEICKKISINHSRHNIGETHSPEVKKKIGEARKGKYTGDRHHMRKFPKFGKESLHWNGGISNSNGYKLVHAPNHPLKDSRNYVRQSRLTVEKVLNRYLTKIEVVHHIDLNPSNDHPSNLYLFPSQSKHAEFHQLLRKNPDITLKSNLCSYF